MLAATLLAAACGQRPAAAPEVVLTWTLSPRAPAVGPAVLSLALADRRDGRPLAGARVRVEADMSHPGMAPLLASVRELAPGVYEAALRFTMAGDWILLVDARLRDGRAWRRELWVRGVRPA
ncbi:MAG TPA: FixH family protein [Thermoanaerobaculia bacterium]|nr:FixH family protein [Thermoanaerobaculia bacterium]